MKLTKITPKTITAPDRLRRIFEEAGRRGYGLVEEELGLGYSAIAAPLSAHGDLRYALAISVATRDYSRADIVEKLLPELLAATDRLARAFPSRAGTVQVSSADGGR